MVTKTPTPGAPVLEDSEEVMQVLRSKQKAAKQQSFKKEEGTERMTAQLEAAVDLSKASEMKEVDGLVFSMLWTAAYIHLVRHVGHLNKINVFPGKQLSTPVAYLLRSSDPVVHPQSPTATRGRTCASRSPPPSSVSHTT